MSHRDRRPGERGRIEGGAIKLGQNQPAEAALATGRGASIQGRDPMKRILIATACLTLMGGGFAMAQPNQPPRTDDTPAAVAPTTNGATDVDPARAASSAGTLSHSDTGDAAKAAMQPGMIQGSTSTMPMTPGATAMVGDQMASNPPPAAGAYPRCTHKGQDRCMASATTHRKAMKPGM